MLAPTAGERPHKDASLRDAFLSQPEADSSSHAEELGGLGANFY